jgi:hypothetical protein
MGAISPAYPVRVRRHVFAVMRPFLHEWCAQVTAFLNPNLRWHHFVTVYIQDVARETSKTGGKS